MAKVPAVKNVSVTSRVPGEWKMFRRVKLKNEGSTDDYKTSYFFGADKDFMKTYEVALAQGRNFDTRADSSAIIINETVAKMLNITEVAGQSDRDRRGIYGAGHLLLLMRIFHSNPG